MSSPPFERIGEYQIVSEIGRGGAASVYHALDTKGRSFALKLLHYIPNHDSGWKRRFFREFQLLSSLRHPHLIRVHELYMDGERPYYTMDYIHGMNLWTFYREFLRPLPLFARLARLLPLTAQVISALDYIHRRKVIHQDVKPANILIDCDGATAYLADFGLAKSFEQVDAIYTRPGFVGTLGYAPPERVRRDPLDGRSDLYSLGVILYTLLADRRPIAAEGRAFENVLHAVQHEIPPSLSSVLADVPTDVEAFVHRMMEKQPEHRFQSARELWQALLPLLERYRPEREEETAEFTLDEPVLPSLDSKGYPTHDLLGREEEFVLFREGLSRLKKEHESQAYLFYGIAGIGKTRLLDELEQLSLHVGIPTIYLRCRSKTTPYSSISGFLRQVIDGLPSSALVQEQAQTLAYYLPELTNILSPNAEHIDELANPIEEIVRLSLPLLRRSLERTSWCWLFDDLEQADSMSLAILRALLPELLEHTVHPFLCVATLTYQAGGDGLPFAMDPHPALERHYLLPLSEEQETAYMTHLLGREVTPKELARVRAFSQGVPLQTRDAMHRLHLLSKPETLVSVDSHESSENKSKPTPLSLGDDFFAELERPEPTVRARLQDLKPPASKSSSTSESHPVQAPVPKSENRFEKAFAWDLGNAEFELEEEDLLSEMEELDEELDELVETDSIEETAERNLGGTVVARVGAESLAEMGSLFLEHLGSQERTQRRVLPPPSESKLHPASALVEEDQKSEVGEETMLNDAIRLQPQGPVSLSESPIRSTSGPSPVTPMDPFEATLIPESELNGATRVVRWPGVGENVEQPPQLQQTLLKRRLKMLSETHRLQLAYASLLGEWFSLDEVSRLGGLSEEEADDLLLLAVSLGVLESQSSDTRGECFRFSSESVTLSLQQAIPSDEWMVLSLKAAGVMEDIREKQEHEQDAAVIVRRYFDAECWVEALLWQLRVVEQAIVSEHQTSIKKELKRLKLHIHRCLEEELADELMSSVLDFLERRPFAFSRELQPLFTQMLWIGLLHELGDDQQAEQMKPKVHQRLSELKTKLEEGETAFWHPGILSLYAFSRLFESQEEAPFFL